MGEVVFLHRVCVCVLTTTQPRGILQQIISEDQFFPEFKEARFINDKQKCFLEKPEQ